jgi:hypothetical protein
MMNKTAIYPVLGLAAALAAGMTGLAPMPAKAADCYAIAEQIAASEGGQVVRAEPADQGGRAVCVIVYTVQPADGGRPKRKQIVVDQN